MSDVPTARELIDELHRLTLTDEAAAVELYADDAVHEIPFSPSGSPVRIEGKARLRELMAAPGNSPVRYEEFADRVVHRTDDPALVIAEYTVKGTTVAGGAPFAFPQLMVLRARAGEIVHTKGYFDPNQLARLMGSA